jgi:enamine deaminase RidA (YjgF/YER057c/UK114 family)
MSDRIKNDAVDQLQAAGDYATSKFVGNLIFTAGMTPRINMQLITTGHLGKEISVSEGKELAYHACARAIEVANQVADANSKKILEAVSLTVYIAASSDFQDHSIVANGASHAIRDLINSKKPVRAAVGVTSLPSGAPVEVQLIVQTN